MSIHLLERNFYPLVVPLSFTTGSFRGRSADFLFMLLFGEFESPRRAVHGYGERPTEAELSMFATMCVLDLREDEWHLLPTNLGQP